MEISSILGIAAIILGAAAIALSIATIHINNETRRMWRDQRPQ